jgi:hypothetical protein
MLSLAAQLQAAGAQAQRMAAEQERQRAEWLERKAKGLPPRRGGLAESLRERLPLGEENALSLAQIRALLADLDYLDNGLTAALSRMANDGEIVRTGEKYSYRYYRKQPN